MPLVNLLQHAGRQAGGGCGDPVGGQAETQEQLLVFAVELEDLEDLGAGLLEGLGVGGTGGFAPGNLPEGGEGLVQPGEEGALAVEQGAVGGAAVRVAQGTIEA